MLASSSFYKTMRSGFPSISDMFKAIKVENLQDHVLPDLRWVANSVVRPVFDDTNR